MKLYPAVEFCTNMPGIFTDLPMDTYQSAPGFSKSQADVLRRSPLDLKRQHDGTLKREATEAMEMGTVLHGLVLEDKARYHIHPATYEAEVKKEIVVKPWNNNAMVCKEWNAEHADAPIYSYDEAAEIHSGANYVRNHPHAKQILAHQGIIEASMFARAPIHGKILKGRADKIWFDQGRIHFADLKKCRDASTRNLSREILNRRYHVQAGMYKYIAELLGYEFGSFTFIFFEDGKAPKCNVRTLAAQAIAEGEKQIKADIELFNRCKISDHWPEWADSEEHIGHVDLPECIYDNQTLELED